MGMSERLEELISQIQYMGGLESRLAEHLIANDVVPVVRCKDCVWYENGKSYDAYCNHPTDGMNYSAEDDFCSYGERKDNETV